MVKLCKKKNISDSKVEGGAGRLGQTRAEPGNTFMGCWKTIGKCQENHRKIRGKYGDLMTFKGIYGCLMIAKLTYKSWLPMVYGEYGMIIIIQWDTQGFNMI